MNKDTIRAITPGIIPDPQQQHAGRDNIPNIKVTEINHFSSFDLVKYNKLILTTTSLRELESRFK